MTWSSSGKSIASVDATGKVDAVAPGTATLSFSYKGASSTVDVTVVARKLTTIELTADNSSVPAGASVQITAHGVFNDNTSQTLGASDGVTLSSSDPAIAKFSPSTFGHLQTLAAGTVTVTARDVSGTEGTLSLTVTTAQLTQIMVTPAATTTPAGIPLQLTATGNYTDSSTQNITTAATWSVTGIANATVAQDGKLTAPTAGTASVTASLDGVTSAPVNITVTAAVLQSIKVVGGNTSVAKGETGTVTLRGTFSDGTQHTVTADSWVSSDPTIMTVDASGNIKAVDVGTATITGASGGFTDDLQYTVTPAVVTQIGVTFPKLTAAQLPAGFQTLAAASGTFSDGSHSDLTSQVVWASSNDSVATVDAAGMISAKATGSAGISATYKSVSGSATLKVTDATLQSVQIQAPDLASAQIIRAKGLTEQVSLVGTFSDGHTAALDSSAVSWTVIDPSVAAVTKDGLVTFLKEGTTTLTGASDSFTSSVQLTTTAAIPVGLDISGPSQVAADTTAQLTAAVLFSNSTTADLTATAAWSTSDPNVAIVVDGGANAGELHASKAGSVTVTAQATQNGTALTGTTSITVTPSSLNVDRYNSLSKTFESCGSVTSHTGSVSVACNTATSSAITQTPAPAWFTIERFRLTAVGRDCDWTVGSTLANDGSGPAVRIVGVSPGDVIAKGTSVEVDLQIQSTGGSQVSGISSVQVIDNAGADAYVFIDSFTMATN